MITDDQLAPIAAQIEKIYRRVRGLQAGRIDRAPSGASQFLTIEEHMAQPLRTRLEAVEDDISGLKYAVWNIGLTVAAVGGRDALDRLFALVEDLDSERSRMGSWLDHRWDGVPIGSGGVWTA